MWKKERKKTFELGWWWGYWLRIEKARHLIRCNLYRKSFDYLGFSLDEGSVSADGFSFNPSSSPTLNNFTFFSPSSALPLLVLLPVILHEKESLMLDGHYQPDSNLPHTSSEQRDTSYNRANIKWIGERPT